MRKENINVVYCPPCGENVGLPTKRGFLDKASSFTTLLPRYAVLPPQGRKMTAHGFTLIELLVVVLIIGILAAVAVPQYQKAVVKSRVFGYLPFVKSLVAAQEAYYLANGQYALYFKDLDVTFPGVCQLQDGKYKGMIYCNDSIVIDNVQSGTTPNGKILLRYCPQKASSFSNCSNSQRFGIQFFLQHHSSAQKAGTIQCTATTGDTLAQQICDAFNAQYQ